MDGLQHVQQRVAVQATQLAPASLQFEQRAAYPARARLDVVALLAREAAEKAGAAWQGGRSKMCFRWRFGATSKSMQCTYMRCR